MAASAPESLKTALDFFGKEDPEGVEKFKTVAFRALHEQRIDEDLRFAKNENERLQKENAALSKQLRELQVSFDTNVDDRERVLAFKSKRIEELNLKLRESEAINSSLLQTINGGAEGAESVGSRASMMALVSSGKPLFHALEACKEQEFRRLYDEKRVQCEQLTQQMQDNQVLVQEMRVFQDEKTHLEEQIQQLQDTVKTVTMQKEEEVHFLERKLVFEHDRLRREKDSDIQACQEEMEKHMRNQLDMTTQRTIEENERVQLELRYQSSQLEKLVKQVDRLMDEKKRVQQEKRIFEDMNASLSKRLKFYEQLFAKMQEKDQLRSKHLNSAADALETHLQQRAFARKQVDAMLRYHMNRHQHQREQLLQPRVPRTASIERQKGVFMGQVPLVKKKIVLSKAVYSPSSYRSGRKMAESPTTLGSFIRQHAAIPPRQRPLLDASRPSAISHNNDTTAADGTVPTATVLPGLVPKAPSHDRSEMWRARHSPSSPESPATARF